MAERETRVLLVDDKFEDEQLIREELALAKGRYRLEIECSLEAALERIRAGDLDVILLDLRLPDAQGITTFLRLFAVASDLPILVLVNQADEDLGAHSLKAGATDYLVKQQVVSNLLQRALRYATERTHTLLALKASEAKFRELFENVATGVFQSTPDGRFISVNPALVKMLGYASEEELLAVEIPRDLYAHAEDRQNWLRAIEEDGEIRNAELALERKDGRSIVVLESARAVRDEHGRALYYEGTITDITEAHEHSRRLSYEASHDALTGLINRREFELRLERLLEDARTQPGQHAVCYMDLDQFKVVNDRCGHVAGDELLRQLGLTLQAKLRKEDTLARLGGDEFAVLLRHCGVDDATGVARELLRAVQEFQFVWGDDTFTIGASLGLVSLDGRHRHLIDVLSAADAACYAAKDQGRNRVHVFREQTRSAGDHGEKRLVARVKQALSEDRFCLDVQPIVRVASHARPEQLYEILARMIDEDGRSIPPGAFLPVAERYNLSARIDEWVIRRTLDWMTRHRDALGNITRLFINVSSGTLADPASPERIAAKLTTAQLPTHKLCFEMSESAAFANLAHTNTLIRTLRQRGCKFALDDFGTGLVSFAYLRALPVDYLKIDGHYVRGIADDFVDFQIVRAITDIGHAQGKEIIAESVENDRIMDRLRHIGVDYAQGYALGRPAAIQNLDAAAMPFSADESAA